MIEDGSTLYNSLAIMLPKIAGYGQMSFRMPQ